MKTQKGTINTFQKDVILFFIEENALIFVILSSR